MNRKIRRQELPKTLNAIANMRAIEHRPGIVEVRREIWDIVKQTAGLALTELTGQAEPRWSSVADIQTDEEQTKVILAVSPDAPEWMRIVAQKMAEGHEGAHGAILTICYDDRQTQLAHHINGEDLISAISNLADLMREKYGGKVAAAILAAAISGIMEDEA